MSVVYEYRCTAGNEPIEHLAALGKAPDEITCPEHGAPAKRQVSRGSFLTFPGSHNAEYRKTS